MEVGKGLPVENAVRWIRAAARSDVGLCRNENQDRVVVVEAPGVRLYAVADGMGGAKGGSVAARMAADGLSRAFSGRHDVNEQSLREAIEEVNREIFEAAATVPLHKGMGTTTVALAFSGTRLFVANVGDSRAYRIRQGRVLRLTDDHTVASELLRAGLITDEQAMKSPVAHVLTRSLGPSEDVEVDCWIVDDAPARGDVYLLCSDGLHSLVSEPEIVDVVTSYPIDDAATRLVEAAKARGGFDNVSVILVGVGDEFPLGRDEPDVRASGTSAPRPAGASVDARRAAPRDAGAMEALRRSAERLRGEAFARGEGRRSHEGVRNLVGTARTTAAVAPREPGALDAAVSAVRLAGRVFACVLLAVLIAGLTLNYFYYRV